MNQIKGNQKLILISISMLFTCFQLVAGVVDIGKLKDKFVENPLQYWNDSNKKTKHFQCETLRRDGLLENGKEVGFVTGNVRKNRKKTRDFNQLFFDQNLELNIEINDSSKKTYKIKSKSGSLDRLIEIEIKNGNVNFIKHHYYEDKKYNSTYTDLKDNCFVVLKEKKKKVVSGSRNRGLFKNNKRSSKVLRSGYAVYDSNTKFSLGGSEKEKSLYPFRTRKRSKIALLTKGEDAFAARMQILDKAKYSVSVQALIFTGDYTGVAIAKKLIELHKKGLKVRIFVDGFSNFEFNPFKRPTAAMYNELKTTRNDKGETIEFIGYELFGLQFLQELSIFQIFRPNMRFHDKIFMIDGETENGIAIVGGRNISDECFNFYKNTNKRKNGFVFNKNLAWRDQDIIVKGEVVKDIQNSFDRNFENGETVKKWMLILNPDIFLPAITWIKEKLSKLFAPILKPFISAWKFISKLLDPYRRWRKKKHRAIMARLKRILEGGSTGSFSIDNLIYRNSTSRWFQNRPRLGETDEDNLIEQAYIKLIDMTPKGGEVILSNAYFVPSDQLIAAVSRGVEERGLKVYIITNSPSANYYLPILTFAGRLSYKELYASNKKARESNNGGFCRVFEWQGDSTNHAKFGIFNKEDLLIGSYNLDPRSLNLNSETAMVFKSSRLAWELRSYMLKSDFANSQARYISEKKAAKYYAPKGMWLKLKKMYAKILRPNL